MYLFPTGKLMTLVTFSTGFEHTLKTTERLSGTCWPGCSAMAQPSHASKASGYTPVRHSWHLRKG